MTNVARKIDGIVLVGRSLSFLPKPVSLVGMLFPAWVDYKEPSRIKCCQSLKKAKRLFFIRVGQISGFEVNICIFSTNARSSFVNYQSLRNGYRQAFDQAMESLGESKPNSASYRSYTENMSHGRSTTYAVYPDDFYEFSDFFCSKLVNIIETYENELGATYQVVVLSEIMGQASTLTDQSYRRLFDSLRKEYLDEAIFHLSYDVSRQHHFVLWSRNALTTR